MTGVQTCALPISPNNPPLTWIDDQTHIPRKFVTKPYVGDVIDPRLKTYTVQEIQ